MTEKYNYKHDILYIYIIFNKNNIYNLNNLNK